MSTSTEPRPAERELPDLDDEREVDLRRQWNVLVQRWWLPAAGLLGGVVIGFLISLGGSQVYTAKATIYVGQPLSSSGVQVQSQATNPSTVHEIVLAPATIEAVARRVGLAPGQIRGRISTQTVSGAITKLGQNPLVSIGVTGHLRGKVAATANALAEAVVTSDALAHYSKIKIASLSKLVDAERTELASIDRRTGQLETFVRANGGSATDRLILANVLNGLVQERRQVVDEQAATQQQLALAKEVEAPRIITFAAATKTTARSRRNTVIVAALIGLLVGIFAALLWEPVGRVVRRPA